jgi:hypothetical protein
MPRSVLQIQFRKTDHLVSTLITYAINRCLLNSLVIITEVVLFVLAPRTLWFMAVDSTVGKLLANSLLASLNGRRYIKDSNIAQSISMTEFSQLRFASPIEIHVSLFYAPYRRPLLTCSKDNVAVRFFTSPIAIHSQRTL